MFGFCEMSDSIKKRNNLNIIRFPVVTFAFQHIFGGLKKKKF